MNPLKDFTHNLLDNKVDYRYYPRVISYYIKFALFEPFRLLEKIFLTKKIKNFKFSKDPIFILGYYRSGTTHLQEVLLQDHQFGYMNFYQCFFSSAFNSTEKIFKLFTNSIIKLVRFKHPAHGIPFHFDMPGEEDVAMVSSGFKTSSNWGQLFPDKFKNFFRKTVFFEHISQNEREEFESQMYNLFKRVGIANENKQLILKSPPQTARIRMLLKFFPNAKFIYIYRNPYEVFKSNKKLWKSFEGQHLQMPTQDEVNDNILWSYNKCLEFYNRDKALLKDNQLVEIKFEDFQQNPIEKIKLIYSTLEVNGFANISKKLEKYLNQKHGKNRASYQYTNEEVLLVKKYCQKWLEYGNYSIPGESNE